MAGVRAPRCLRRARGRRRGRPHDRPGLRDPHLRPGRGRFSRSGEGVPGRLRRTFPAGMRWCRRLLRRQGIPVYRGRSVGRRGGPVPGRVDRRRAGRRPARRLPRGAHRHARQQQDGGRDRAGPRLRRRADRPRQPHRDRPDRRGGAEARCRRSRDDPGDRRRRGAHPRVHRDGARGPEVRALARNGRRRRGRPPGRRPARVDAADRAAQPHRQPDLRHRRIRGVRPATHRPARRHRP